MGRFNARQNTTASHFPGKFQALLLENASALGLHYSLFAAQRCGVERNGQKFSIR